MKKLFLLLIFPVIIQASYAQDSIRVSYSQESDTLVKQRFIDRYENVFMTKVPTRQMFKVGYSGYNDAGLRLGYEFKIWPNISLEAAIYTIRQRYTIFTGYTQANSDIWGAINIRWYHKMNQRIDKALSASNFSGSYFGLSYEQSIHQGKNIALRAGESGRFGLSYGFQSRFFSKGYANLSVGLFSKGYWRNAYWPDLYDKDGFFNPEDFVITTQSSFGFAFGDWKRSKRTPACEVLLCDEDIKGHWKLQVPDITVGLQLQKIGSSVAYERRLWRSPFSLSANVDARLDRTSDPYRWFFIYQANAGVELRYYYTQKEQVRRGLGGYNLSGPYIGAGANTQLVGSILKVDVSDRHASNGWYKAGTISFGYQQRLFKSTFIDASLYYSNLLGNYPIYYIPERKISAKVAVGFTF